MIREIVKDTFFLSQKSEPATRQDQPVIQDLLDTVRANADRCVGTAANMIGERKTILVAQAGKDYLVMVNPKIVDHSRQCYETEESCLSLTGQRPVKRYSVIVVEYLDRKFKRKKQTFRDFEAQIIQHEMDHFEGIII
ncbi:peptide deformylase [Ruminococcus callidus]|uniref:peptide deformylase n=1 Tax=Ruminococcus callidus TaxID=40519 RepID=UPI0026DA98CF|nr:peptide deformylase [uncultured Ruminococcus sp.]